MREIDQTLALPFSLRTEDCTSSVIVALIWKNESKEKTITVICAALVLVMCFFLSTINKEPLAAFWGSSKGPQKGFVRTHT